MPARMLKLVLFLLLAVCAASASARAQGMDGEAVALTFPGSGFHLQVPLGAPGRLTAELLDTESTVRSTGSTDCLGAGPCQLDLPPARARVPGVYEANDLALYRVRLTVVRPGRGPVETTLAVARIAPSLFELHLAAADTVRPGAVAEVRLRAVHPLTGAPRGGVTLFATASADLEDRTDDVVITRQTLHTDAAGFATFRFRAPASGQLNSVETTVTGSLGNLKLDASVTLRTEDRARLEVTTDKPLYQPGQVLHMRLLALDRAGQAEAGRSMTIEIRDPDSTLLFRTEATTSRFGLAVTDWQIPARLRLGAYEITAAREGKSDTARASVRISQYDLPAFTVTPTPDRAFYLPGQDADVLIHADYLFGKPVLHGHVRVVREEERQWNPTKRTYDVKEETAVEGDLDAQGNFHAHIALGNDEAQYVDTDPGNDYTDVHFAAYLTDRSTNRTEPRKFDLRVTRQALHLYLVGERDQAAGLPERLFLAVSLADGTPAPHCTVSLALLPAGVDPAPGFPHETLDDRLRRASPLPPVTTDARGLVAIDLPTWEAMQALQPGQDSPTLYLAVRDAVGQTGALEEDVPRPEGTLRVTAGHVLLHPGEPIAVTVESAILDLAITVEALRITSRGPALLVSRDVVLHGGRAFVSLPADARFSGEIELVAFALRPIAGGTQPVYDRNNDDDAPKPVVSASTPVLFPRDNSLHLALKTDKPLYRAGEQVTATVAVSGPQDPDGDDRHAGPVAVGLVVVDQAVEERNRTDNGFGGGDSSFFLHPWAVFPGERGGVTVAGLDLLPPGKPFPGDLDLPARMLLSGAGREVTTDSNAPPSNLAQVFSNFFAKQLFDVRKALHDFLQTCPEPPTDEPGLAALLLASGIDLQALRDPWGMPYSVAISKPSGGRLSLQLVSGGPDRTLGTADDFPVEIANWTWFAVHLKQIGAAVHNFHEHTHGFIRDRPTLLAELRREGLQPDTWSSPEGEPITYDFEVQGARFVVSVESSSRAGRGSRRYNQTYNLGQVSIDYFDDDRLRLQGLLNAWSAHHPFPTTQAELDEALAASGLSLRDFHDASGDPVYVLFSHRNLFADRTETVAGPGTAAHTTITPVTRVVDVIQIRSHGRRPDQDSSQDQPQTILLATLTHVRSEQSAAEQTAHPPGSRTVRPGHDGGLAGVVSDSTGAVIPGAIAVLTDDAGFRQEAMTDGEGRYGLDPIPPGTYTLQVSAQGFVAATYRDIRVTPRSAVELDLKLEAGEASESVTVSAEMGDIVDTQSAEVSRVIDGGTVRDLALNGRNYLGLLGVLPGSVIEAEPMATPRLRDYFPETLLWRPEIITAPNGTATVRFPVADSLTRWQLFASASTLGGNVGGARTEFASFQPFFAVFDPPPVLTVGDTLALPVALRNYTGKPLNVEAALTPAPWFRADAPPLPTPVPAQDSASPVFRFTAIAPVDGAKQEFTATAGREGDRIARPVSVHPDGHEVAATDAALIVPGTNVLEITVPDGALPGGNSAELKVYPNLAAHLREALTGLLAEPHGCAEQIISAAWPSLLLEQYGASLPGSAHAKGPGTRHFLEEAYANLLPEQKADGGFGYWSTSPHADPALTAYAIHFLSAAGALVTVDPAVIEHALEYLGKQQASDGRWLTPGRDGRPDPGATRANAMLTASIAANLAYANQIPAQTPSMVSLAPKAGPLLARALAGLTPFVREFDEPYTLASYALATLAWHDRTYAAPALARLRALALTENGGVYWALEANTPFYGAGRAGRVETTAQVLRALLAAGDAPQDSLVARGFLFLNHQQDRDGLWYSSQASARALDVLAALALRTPVDGNAQPAPMTVQVDGAPARSVPLPPAATEAGPILIPFGAGLGPGPHRMTLTLPVGSSSATAQAVARSYISWPASQPESSLANHEQLRLTVQFGSVTPRAGEPVTVSVHAERIGFRGYGMLLAEIGLPPGAEVDRATLETALAASNFQLNRYEVLPDRVILYLDPRAGGLDLRFAFRLRYSIDALTAPSTIYDFYNPDAHMDLRPTRLTSPDLK